MSRGKTPAAALPLPVRAAPPGSGVPNPDFVPIGRPGVAADRPVDRLAADHLAEVVAAIRFKRAR